MATAGAKVLGGNEQRAERRLLRVEHQTWGGGVK